MPSLPADFGPREHACLCIGWMAVHATRRGGAGSVPLPLYPSGPLHTRPRPLHRPAFHTAEIPPQGVSGLLVVADPEDGCKPLKPPHPSDLQLEGEAAAAWAAAADLSGGEAPWIALVARTQDREGCTFDVKARAGMRVGRLKASVARQREGGL